MKLLDCIANYPPIDADSSTGVASPTISVAANSENTGLTGWTSRIPGRNVDRASAAMRGAAVPTVVVS